MSTKYERTPPANMIEPILGPMIYPTPSSSGEISAEIDPPLKFPVNIFSGISFHPRRATMMVLYAKPIPKPVKIVFAFNDISLADNRALGEAAALDSADAPALRTSAHAVPSGYFKT